MTGSERKVVSDLWVVQESGGRGMWWDKYFAPEHRYALDQYNLACQERCTVRIIRRTTTEEDVTDA